MFDKSIFESLPYALSASTLQSGVLEAFSPRHGDIIPQPFTKLCPKHHYSIVCCAPCHKFFSCFLAYFRFFGVLQKSFFCKFLKMNPGEPETGVINPASRFQASGI